MTIELPECRFGVLLILLRLGRSLLIHVWTYRIKPEEKIARETQSSKVNEHV